MCRTFWIPWPHGKVDFLPVSSLQRCELLFQSGNLILHLLHLHELVGTKRVGWQRLAHIFQLLPPRVEALTQILSLITVTHGLLPSLLRCPVGSTHPSG